MERVDIVNQMFLCQALRAPGFDGVAAAAHRILLAGGRWVFPILPVCQDWALASLSADLFGRWECAPSSCAGLLALKLLLKPRPDSPRRSWTAVAHDFGYYDQMHMVHDFQEFTGITPTETLAQT